MRQEGRRQGIPVQIMGYIYAEKGYGQKRIKGGRGKGLKIRM